MVRAHGEETRAVFLLAFAKNEKDNITPRELESLKTIATLWLEADDKSVERAIKEGELARVQDEKTKD